jgi:hypothetical protein
VNRPIGTQVRDDHTVAVVSLPLVGNGEDSGATHAGRTLRQQVIPSTIGRVGGTTVTVGSAGP